MKKRLLPLFMIVGLTALLTGCMEIDQPITTESEGIWNSYFVYPLSWLITTIAQWSGDNYGLGIVLVTLIIRFALLPLMIKQTKNTKKMQEIQPEMLKLKEKYSSKDAQTQQKLQQETMAMFQKNGVNPLAGCFPLLIQMPILIAFYHAIVRTTEIANHNFLWFDLGERDPFFILPLVAGVTTYLQQKIMMAGNPAGMNPQMQMMLYLMPVMIVVFAITFPSALSLYWVVGNIFMIVQTLIINGTGSKKVDQSVQ
ncbi:YidC family membrane integrase SpoIIIJ [Jeotgalibacillus campisalis]|uniref:Membrane protein insertase YidC n=1 Tax=Jeotgalibacillus campisalis TaxID=220754 RepID=A0A0C2RSI2_9BACL|nr:YidC family membrane integrase SpoIIIJ [Jeotgalibacillus campisalis]KIL53195.1 OxaA precursor [Jeotgalibacillus campisalis]